MTIIAFALLLISPCTLAANCSTQIFTFSPIACGCSSTKDLSRYSAFFLS
ncbi:MAG: hypothetical protein M3495_16435 [Pseudomonadota bacterium]|nr:hypothetical protein [Pseudomonadota bacterium]